MNADGSVISEERKGEIIKKLREQKQTSITDFASRLRLLPVALKWTTPPPSIANSFPQAMIFRELTGKWAQYTTSTMESQATHQKSIFSAQYNSWDSVIQLDLMKHWGIIGCGFARETSAVHSSAQQFDKTGGYLLQGYPSGEILLGDFQSFQEKQSQNQQQLLQAFEKHKNLPKPLARDPEEELQVIFADPHLGFVHTKDEQIQPVAYINNALSFKPQVFSSNSNAEKYIYSFDLESLKNQ
jgi:hypothetical protein